MTKNNDPCVLLFFERQDTIVIGAQKAKDGLVSVLAAVILKGLDEKSRGIFFAKAFDDLDLGVDAIVVVNEAADKANHDDAWTRGNSCRGSRGPRTRLTRDEEHRKNQENDPERGKHAPHRDRETTSIKMR